MRSYLFGLTVPLLLLSAGFLMVIPPTTAESALYEVSGRVTSDAGAPLEGVRVSGYSSPSSEEERASYVREVSHRETVTDAEGRYVLLLPAGKGHVSAYHEEWRQGAGRDLVIEGNVSGVDFTLKTPPPRTARVEGVVVDAAGAPVAGAQVRLESSCCYAMPEPAVLEEGGSASDGEGAAPAVAPASPPYEDWQSTTTGSDGRFAFEAYAGPRQVTAYAKGFAQTTVPVEARDGETTRVELRLEKVPAKDAVVSGRVVDAATGLPVEGAHVSVRSLEWGRYAGAQTGADGSFRVETLPGWVEIGVSYYPRHDEARPVSDAMLVSPRAQGPQYYAYSLVAKLASGENAQEVRLEPKPKPTIVLVGYVVDPDAQAGVEGARVHVWNQDTGDWGEAVTDATGSYRLLVRAGHYSANAWKDGYLGGTQTFVVTEEAAQRQDLVLPKGTHKYAPCDEDCEYVLYDKAVASEGAPTAAPSGAPAPMVAESDERAAFDASAASTREGAATFEGGGGNLPPYDPAAAGSVPAAKRDDPLQIPAPGAVAALGLLGLAALALRRR